MASTTKAVNNPTYLGSMIAGQQYQANQGLPNEYDVDAELFGNVKKQFGGDGKPRGIDALISGIATGAEYGSKMKGIGLRKEELAKYNKVMDYFMAANMEAEKANKKNMEMEEKRQSLMPYGLAGMELSYSGMPYESVNEKMRNLFEQAQLNDPNIKGKYIGFIPNSPLLNIRDENGKDSVFSLAKIVGEDGVKRIQGDWVERQKMDVQQQGLKLQERGLGIQQQNANTSKGHLELEKAKATGENGESEADKLFLQESTKAAAKDAAEYRKNVRQDYEEAQKLEQVSKDIKEALKAGAFTNEGSASRVRAFFGLAAGGKGATATQMLQQAAGNLIPKIKDAFGGRVTNTDLEFAEEFMLPGSKISKASNEKFLQGLDRLISRKKQQYVNLENIADENGGMLPRDYLSRLRKIEESNNVQQSNMGQQEDKVLVKTPQGVGYISREQYNALKQ